MTIVTNITSMSVKPSPADRCHRARYTARRTPHESTPLQAIAPTGGSQPPRTAPARCAHRGRRGVDTALAARSSDQSGDDDAESVHGAAKDRALPAAIAEKAKHHILDTFAAMISGSELPPGRAALAFARAHAGQPVATVIGSSTVTAAMDAALANGILAHSR
jgi:hypothetical protein